MTEVLTVPDGHWAGGAAQAMSRMDAFVLVNCRAGVVLISNAPVDCGEEDVERAMGELLTAGYDACDEEWRVVQLTGWWLDTPHGPEVSDCVWSEATVLGRARALEVLALAVATDAIPTKVSGTAQRALDAADGTGAR